MKIIFVRDVPKVGKKHQIKDVAPGYAQNFLFRQGHAIPATPKSIAEVERVLSLIKTEKEVNDSLLQKNLKDLAQTTLTFTAKANDKGHLFSAIHEAQISAELKSQKNIDISAHMIKLDHPIKEIGDHKVKVQAGDKNGFLSVSVKAQN